MISLRFLALVALSAAPAAALPGDPAEILAKQWQEYQTVAPKTVLQLQPWRQETDAALPDGGGVKFVSLNPNVNAWFLAEVTAADGSVTAFHIENPDPRGQPVSLATTPAVAVALGGPKGDMACDLFGGSAPAIEQAAETGMPYAPLCGGRLFLRNKSHGAQSTLESVTDFLRNNIWGGDAMVNFVKNNFYQDAFAQTGKVVGDQAQAPDAGPGHAAVTERGGAAPAITGRTDLRLTGVDGGRMELGAWYPVEGAAGIFASAMEPGMIAPEVLNGPGVTRPLDNVESSAIDYFVAFDMSKYDIGYAVGTTHPEVNWSPRPPDTMQNPALPGPDGIGNIKPLVRLGMIDPAYAAATIATFTGGFKREHGAFHRGPYSQVNNGDHYGFIEEGTILSKLWPGLSTLYVLADGTWGFRTWTEADNAMLPQIRFARQNGLPLIEPDPATGAGIPGQYVSQWVPGNWSGSAEAQLRTLRGGLCLKETATTKYLIYGYFSTATPSAMARTFQAYGCSYAMQLDMNALEHTYLAVYPTVDGQRQVEHLVPGMAAVDKHGSGGTVLPRFIAFPDNRDFFWLMRKS